MYVRSRLSLTPLSTRNLDSDPNRNNPSAICTYCTYPSAISPKSRYRSKSNGQSSVHHTPMLLLHLHYLARLRRFKSIIYFTLYDTIILIWLQQHRTPTPAHTPHSHNRPPPPPASRYQERYSSISFDRNDGRRRPDRPSVYPPLLLVQALAAPPRFCDDKNRRHETSCSAFRRHFGSLWCPGRRRSTVTAGANQQRRDNESMCRQSEIEEGKRLERCVVVLLILI